MMKKQGLEISKIALILGVTLSVNISDSAFSQVVDDFSDGNLTSGPCWQGDTGLFEVNSLHQLHLKSAGTDSSYLATPSSLLDSTEWILWVKLSFSPSANNFARIYLASEQDVLTDSPKGFYLQLGEAGSSDAITLFRRQGGQDFQVCRGKEGFIAASFAVRIKVTRNMQGLWSLYADSTGGNLFQLQATGIDSTEITPAWFGIYCRYTSSNATKFYFDEVIVRNIMVDLDPPVALTVKTTNDRTLAVKFNETLHPASVSDTTHYLVSDNMGHPLTAMLNPANSTEVILTFDKPFLEMTDYTLSLEGIEDLSGNLSGPSQLPFLYYRPKAYDIVFNEIMADPEPQVGLPPVEYLELFNRTAYPIDISGWKLRIGSATKTVASCSLPGHSYLILADSNARIFFQAYGAFTGFPTFSLSNEGTTLTLENCEGHVISSVTYGSDWYRDPLKENGGWSLEQIDPANPCGGKQNWKASTAGRGGTPGSENAVSAANPDGSLPLPSRISVNDPQIITLTFAEPLDSSCIKGPSAFRIDPDGQQPVSIQKSSPDYDELEITLAEPMEKGLRYSLVFLDTLTDCAGNQLAGGFSLPFGLPELPGKEDVVINEILFAPADNGAEFVELFNISGKILDLRDLLIAELDTSALSMGNRYNVSAKGCLFFPGDYVALTTDPDLVRQQYFTSNPAGILEMHPFPSLNNEGGCISLVSTTDLVLDTAVFSVNMQFPLLTTTEGVSLERIDAAKTGTACSNWHSASSASGYATPAMKNSQCIDAFVRDSDISLDPPVFSPDNDGYQDILTISYRLEKPGYVANIRLFNATGQPVKMLTSKEILGTCGSFFWDGLDDQGKKLPMGIYIAFFQFFNLDGKVNNIKKITVLGGKL
ncbi:MAG: lamin tail domain-containing protein [Bacteroidetes bacterium]|nr:lamin tail domain-containing protein [Bacteroidota bacterium]